jgi:hypothetical protein
VELVTRAGEAAQSHPLEAVMGFQVGNAHLHLLAFIAGFGEGLGAGEFPRLVARGFVDITPDLA